MYIDYVKNHEKALNTLKKLNSNKKFQSFVDTTAGEQGKIQDYLILPVQRIPRYRMLLRELLKHTAETHPDFQPLTQALDLVSTVAGQINEAIRERENRDKILKIQDKLGNVNMQLI